MAFPSNPFPLEAQRLAIGYQAPLAQAHGLRLQGGRVTALLGANGQGKSTLIRTLAGLQPALQGQVLLMGQPLERLPLRERAKHLALVLTQRQPLGTLTVAELAALGRSPHTPWHGRLSDADRRLVGDCLLAVGLGGYEGRAVDSLSDGERQKALLARALAQQTPVLLLDEPTAHLDVANRVEIFRLLRRLARERGLAVLASTHELDMALHHADEAWLVSEGQVWAGMPEELVLGGHFDRAFPQLPFDWGRPGGLLRPEWPEPWRQAPPVRLLGDPTRCLWTRQALRRQGFAVGQEGLAVRADERGWHWEGGEARTLSELLAQLEAIEMVGKIKY
jgi:iron complex transport system ATP-binding protein